MYRSDTPGDTTAYFEDYSGPDLSGFEREYGGLTGPAEWP